MSSDDNLYLDGGGRRLWRRGRGLAWDDVGLQKVWSLGLTRLGMKSFWSGNPNVEGSNPSGPTISNCEGGHVISVLGGKSGPFWYEWDLIGGVFGLRCLNPPSPPHVSGWMVSIFLGIARVLVLNRIRDEDFSRSFHWLGWFSQADEWPPLFFFTWVFLD